jgi:hypothetical protein
MDISPLVNVAMRIIEPSNPLGGLRPPRAPWLADARRGVGSLALWFAVVSPWEWWIRLFLPLVPIAVDQLVRSGYQHKSAHYLGFMPPTALFRAMFPRSPRVPEANPSAGASM